MASWVARARCEYVSFASLLPIAISLRDSYSPQLTALGVIGLVLAGFCCSTVEPSDAAEREGDNLRPKQKMCLPSNFEPEH